MDQMSSSLNNSTTINSMNSPLENVSKKRSSSKFPKQQADDQEQEQQQQQQPSSGQTEAETTTTKSHFVESLHKEIVHCSKVGTAEELATLISKLKEINRKYNLSSVTDSYGDSCLHVAAIRSRPIQVLKILIEDGKIDVDIHDDDEEETPAFWAARAGANSLIEFLFEHGADLEAENKFGDTPMEVARKCGKLETASFLHQFIQDHAEEIEERQRRKREEEEMDDSDDDFDEEFEEEEEEEEEESEGHSD